MRFLLLLILLTILSEKTLASNECAKLSKNPLKIYYDVDIAQPVVDHSMTSAQLTQKRKGSINEWNKNNQMQSGGLLESLFGSTQSVGGMTTVKHNLGLKYKTHGRSLGKYGDLKCPVFSYVDLNLKYHGTIFIPREYKKDGCAYNAIFNHEMEHYVIGAENLHKLSKTVRKNLPALTDKLSQDMGVVGRTQLTGAREMMADNLYEIIRGVFQETKQKTAKESAAIDTPEEYADVQAQLDACAD